MKLKGLHIFREKLPYLSGKRIILLPIFVLTILILFGTAIFYIYSLPFAAVPFSPLWQLLAIFIIESVALFLIYQMWYWRDLLKARYQKKSYQRIIFFGLAGICLIIALSFNNLTPIGEINPGLWKDPSLSFWIKPLTLLLGIDIIYLTIVRYLISGFLLILGIITIARSLLSFGVDYMALVYLYFPEEGKIQSFEIYSVIRHPAYAGLTLISISGFIFNFCYYSAYN